jgi:hypothetical protein
MMPNDLVDDEAQKFFGKIRIKLCIGRQSAEPRNLAFLATWISRGQTMIGLVSPNRLRDLEPFGEHENKRRIDIVDAFAVMLQLRVGHLRLPSLHLP